LITTSRPVAARARRTALIAASVPELVIPHHLGRGHAGDDLLGQLDLGRGGSAKARAVSCRLRDGGQHCRVGVAEDQRSPGADPVEVAVAVDVDQLAALSTLDEDRLALDLPHRPHRTVNSPRKDLHRPLVQLGGHRSARRRFRHYECSASHLAYSSVK
jgi:hypothetical protein